MAKGTGGTIYLIGLVFAIIVAFACLGGLLWVNSEMVKVQEELRRSKDELKKERDAGALKAAEITQLNKLINGGTAAINYDSFMTQHLAEAHKKLQETLSEEWITTAEVQTIKDPDVKKNWEYLATFKDKQVPFDNLVAYQTECLRHLQAVIHTVPKLKIEAMRAREERDQKQDQMETLRKAKDEEIKKIRDDKNKYEDDALDKQQKLDAQVRQLREQNDRLQKDQAQLIKDKAVELSRLDRDKTKLQARIDELTRKQRKGFFDTARPDGEVTYADAKLGYAWIDLGQVHGLRRGTRFLCYQQGRGGRQRVKAMLEVKKVDQDSAQAVIVPDYEYVDEGAKEKRILPEENDPVVKGDLIVTPVFERADGHPQFAGRDARPKFYFLGKTPGQRYYNSVPELARKIEEFGGKVLTELTADVDFVVILPKGEEGDQPSYQKATEFGMTFMREDELLEYLGK